MNAKANGGNVALTAFVAESFSISPPLLPEIVDAKLCDMQPSRDQVGCVFERTPSIRGDMATSLTHTIRAIVIALQQSYQQEARNGEMCQPRTLAPSNVIHLDWSYQPELHMGQPQRKSN